MIIYDNQFNENEWFIIIVSVVMYTLIFLLPKKFSLGTSITLLLLGFYIGLLSDHSISIPPFDFYDVNDNSKYEVFDILTYVMYGPFGYFLIYFYEHFKIRGYKTIFYIIVWTFFAIILEYVGTKFGIFHYKQGYRLAFSVPIYVGLQSLTIFYYVILKNKANQTNQKE
ncbi:hypothetical protein JOC85_003853 [Bacillus mesophilus]|uniref:Uncharacterized protein n=1 Tax=Bacillus mesophilus TaxID=1808955 RepID=A0A6M0QBE2_9BACI|nr:hypothetical protein [Bacillus mesophilus]MBM7663027.1 hypothetical protein [Bacillus mesophilus]NEY73652.1 hypothetical protein [Bacillus mesophilus]